MKIRSNIDEVLKALKVMQLDLKEKNVNEHDLFDITLATEEALVNAVKYGNNCDPGLTIDFEYAIDSRGFFKVAIKDQGKGFDYEHLPDPTIDLNFQNVSGRGLYLIKKLMDSVEFSNHGSCINMTKVLNRRKE